MLVEFYLKQKEAGPVEYVRIHSEPGQVLDRPATDLDRDRWPEQYAAFKAPPVPAPALEKPAKVYREPELAEEPKKSVLSKVFKKSK